MDKFLKENARTLAFKKGDVIYDVGSFPKSFFMVIKGKVDLKEFYEYGDAFITTVQPGETLGDLEYFSGKPRVYQAIAAEPTSLLEIYCDTMPSFASAFPGKIIEMLSQFSAKVRAANHELMLSNSSEKTFTEGKTLDITQINDIILIEGAREYAYLLPDAHVKFLFLKDIECPVCGTTFKANHIRYSKLEMVETEYDFRRSYNGFDDLWYHIWRCPTCSYTHFNNEFFKPNNKVIAELKTTLPRYNHTQKSLVKRTMNEVLADHYQLNLILTIIKAPSLTKARLWQSMSWLMDDVGDEETKGKMKRILRQYYEDAWYNNTIPLEEEDEFKLAIKLGHLFKEEGNTKEARNYYFKASQLKTIPAVYKQLAQTLLAEFRNT